MFRHVEGAAIGNLQKVTTYAAQRHVINGWRVEGYTAGEWQLGEQVARENATITLRGESCSGVANVTTTARHVV